MSATPFGNNGWSSVDELSAESLKQHVKKSVYADLIPRVWRLSNLPLGPFILQTKTPCDKEPSGWVSGESAKKDSFCNDNEWYILTSPPDPDTSCA